MGYHKYGDEIAFCETWEVPLKFINLYRNIPFHGIGYLVVTKILIMTILGSLRQWHHLVFYTPQFGESNYTLEYKYR
jgi:hypothetical protein